jgi:hypothetical protein
MYGYVVSSGGSLFFSVVTDLDLLFHRGPSFDQSGDKSKCEWPRRKRQGEGSCRTTKQIFLFLTIIIPFRKLQEDQDAMKATERWNQSQEDGAKDLFTPSEPKGECTGLVWTAPATAYDVHGAKFDTFSTHHR